MGWSDIVCLNNKKAFHVKIILLDKQELIQEVQVRRGVVTALGREGGGGDSVDYGEGGGVVVGKLRPSSSSSAFT